MTEARLSDAPDRFAEGTPERLKHDVFVREKVIEHLQTEIAAMKAASEQAAQQIAKLCTIMEEADPEDALWQLEHDHQTWMAACAAIKAGESWPPHSYPSFNDRILFAALQQHIAALTQESQANIAMAIYEREQRYEAEASCAAIQGALREALSRVPHDRTVTRHYVDIDEAAGSTWDESDAPWYAAAKALLSVPREPQQCLCGLDTSTNGTRFSIVCPKHDGVFTDPPTTPEGTP